MPIEKIETPTICREMLLLLKIIKRPLCISIGNDTSDSESIWTL